MHRSVGAQRHNKTPLYAKSHIASLQTNSTHKQTFTTSTLLTNPISVVTPPRASLFERNQHLPNHRTRRLLDQKSGPVFKLDPSTSHSFDRFADYMASFEGEADNDDPLARTNDTHWSFNTETDQDCLLGDSQQMLSLQDQYFGTTQTTMENAASSFQSTLAYHDMLAASHSRSNQHYQFQGPKLTSIQTTEGKKALTMHTKSVTQTKAKAEFHREEFQKNSALTKTGQNAINYNDFATRLMSDIDKAMLKHECPPQGPNLQRLEIYRDAFQKLVMAMPSYAHVIQDVKDVYDAATEDVEDNLTFSKRTNQEYVQLTKKKVPGQLLRTRDELNATLRLNQNYQLAIQRCEEQLQKYKDASKLLEGNEDMIGSDAPLRAMHDEIFFLEKALVSLKKEQKQNYVPTNVVKWLESTLLDLQSEILRLNQFVEDKLGEYNELIELFAYLKVQVSAVQEQIDALNPQVARRSSAVKMGSPSTPKSVENRRRSLISIRRRPILEPLSVKDEGQSSPSTPEYLR